MCANRKLITCSQKKLKPLVAFVRIPMEPVLPFRKYNNDSVLALGR